MNWPQRLDRATTARSFQFDDIVAAFNRQQNLLSEFGFAVDAWGLAIDDYAQRLSDKFGWQILSDNVAGAVLTFQAMAELAAVRSQQRAA